jgi:hypothetical protein
MMVCPSCGTEDVEPVGVWSDPSDEVFYCLRCRCVFFRAEKQSNAFPGPEGGGGARTPGGALRIYYPAGDFKPNFRGLAWLST